MALAGFSRFFGGFGLPNLNPNSSPNRRHPRAPASPSTASAAPIVSDMDYAKSFSLMLDLDIFSRFATFALPAGGHFYARLRSLFAFAC